MRDVRNVTVTFGPEFTAVGVTGRDASAVVVLGEDNEALVNGDGEYDRERVVKIAMAVVNSIVGAEFAE